MEQHYPLLQTAFSFSGAAFAVKKLKKPALSRLAIFSFFAFFACQTVTAQNATATWSMTTNATATVSGNISATNFTSSGFQNPAYSSNGYSANNLDGNRSNSRYLQFAITPAAGYKLTITDIISTNSVSTIATPNKASFEIQYSYAGNFNSPVTVGTAVTPGTSAGTTSNSSLNIIVSSGQTLYVRIFAWGLSNNSTIFTTKDFKILGNACPTTAVIAYPNAAYCKDPNTTITPTLTGAAGGVYSAASGLAINSTTGTVDVTNSIAGTYTISYTVAASGCTSLTTTTTLRINDLPTAFTLTGPDGATAEFCTNGSPATFTLSGSQEGVDYTFTPINPGGNTPPGQSFTVEGVGGTLNFVQTPDGNWAYKVIGQDEVTGCINTMEGILRAVDGPRITSQPVSAVSACAGGAPIALTLNVSNANSLKWEVSTNNGSSWTPVSGNANYSVFIANNQSTTTLTISNYTTAMSGYIYRVVIGGPSACPVNYSSETILTVATPSTIVTQPVSKSVCHNSTLALSVVATGATSYQWYKNGSRVTGATAATFSGTFNAATDAGGYYVKVTGSCGSLNSATAVITANTNPSSTTWQGPSAGSGATSGTAWEVAGNWSCGVPTRIIDAVIPADIMDGYPNIKSTVTGEVRNLVINSGALGGFLTVEGKLQIFGTVTNNGGVFDVTNGTIEFSGSTTQTIPAGTFSNNTVKSLVISNNVNLAGDLNLTGALSFGNVNNQTFATAGYLTLNSGSSETARVADITNNTLNSGNTITGNVSVERYLPSHRRYRLVTSPVQGATMNTTWQEGRTWNGVGAEVSGYGTLITGASQGSVTNANNNGFDFWTATSGASAFKYSGSLSVSGNMGATWKAVSNTKTEGFDNHEAYLVFVRGDRTVSTTTGATTLRAKGPLKEAASHTITVQKQSHTLVGNPFASPLNFRAVYNDNSAVVEPFYWIWQASLGSGTGGYVLVQPNGTGGYEAVPSANAGSAIDPVIGSGEGFFLVPKAAASLPANITIHQKHKTSGAPVVQAFRQMGYTMAKLRINVYADINGVKTLLDGTLAQYSEGHTAATNDVVKSVNGAENLSVFRAGKDLIVASAPLPVNGEVLQLRLWNLAARTYQLHLQSSQFAIPGLSAVLRDNYLKTETPVQLADAVTSYVFNITADVASKDPQRFSIIFRTAVLSTLPLQLADLKAMPVASGVQVEWEVADESGIVVYEVEKSADGTRFTSLAKLTTRGATGSQHYETIDKQPSHFNYYRVKMTGVNGEVKYSGIVKVEWKQETDGLTVFPNPATGGVINLQLRNKPAGIYHVGLVNTAGQKVWQQSFSHGGGTAITPLVTGKKLASGLYSLELYSGDKKLTSCRLQVLH